MSDGDGKPDTKRRAHMRVAFLLVVTSLSLVVCRQPAHITIAGIPDLVVATHNVGDSDFPMVPVETVLDVNSSSSVPDVLILQEVDTSSYVEDLVAAIEELSGFSYWSVYAPQNRIVILSRYPVIDERELGEKREVIPKRDWSWINVLTLDTPEEHITFSTLRDRFGDGESACLSLAIHRQKSILTDDLDVRKYAQRVGIPVSGMIGLLVRGIKNSLLSLEKANDLLKQMIEHGYYSPFQTLDRLMSE